MKERALPSQEYLKLVFSFNPLNGELRWILGRNRGKVAGCKKFDKKGMPHCIVVKLGVGDQRQVKVHRVIWKLITGYDPHPTVDHIDRNPFNNSWSNLREATFSMQCSNQVRGPYLINKLRR